jgi:hypothetical protein
MLIQHIERNSKVLLALLIGVILSVGSMFIVNVGSASAVYMTGCSGSFQPGSYWNGPGYFTSRCDYYGTSGVLAFRARVLCSRQGYYEYRYSGWKYTTGGVTAYCPSGSYATSGSTLYQY